MSRKKPEDGTPDSPEATPDTAPRKPRGRKVELELLNDVKFDSLGEFEDAAAAIKYVEEKDLEGDFRVVCVLKAFTAKKVTVTKLKIE